MFYSSELLKDLPGNLPYGMPVSTKFVSAGMLGGCQSELIVNISWQY